jgi:hypothetical protein
MYPKSDDVKEVYYVLKANQAIKHGDYFSFYKGTLTKDELRKKDFSTGEFIGFKEVGHFDNNLKEGTWISYSGREKKGSQISYNRIYEEGKFVKDKKTGIWETQIENGKVTKRFDFDANQELEPIVKVNLRYPSQARKNLIEGTVTVKVDYENCEPIAYSIIKDIGYGCGDVVIEVLKEKSELEKKYGVKSNNCDKTEETLDFKFRLEK